MLLGTEKTRTDMTYLLYALTFLLGFFFAAALAAGKNADNDTRP